MNKNAKIYVAGHRGLVGSAILRRLEEDGYTNIVTRTHEELDLNRQDETEKFFAAEKPEYVFLAAARVGGIVANMTYTAEFIYQNLMIATNVIEAAYKNGVKKLLNLGSSCIYPREAPQPMEETHLLAGKLEPTNEPYAIAKIAAIKLCRYYNHQYGTNYISVMPTNLFGPGDNYNLETSHVLPAVMRKFHLARLLREKNFGLIRKDIEKRNLGFGINGKLDLDDDGAITSALEELGVTADHVLLWGTGKPLREFLYVDDLADACVFLMEKHDYGDIGEFINVGSGTDISIKEIATTIMNVIGFEGELRHDTSKPDGMFRKLMDNSRIKNLGWEPKHSLEEGIEKAYRLYLGTLEGSE